MSEQLLTLKSCTASVCELEEFITVVARKYNIHQDKYPDMLISLTEAVNNAIIHGNKSDESKLVRILMKQTMQSLVFKISDEGEGFDPSAVADPTEEKNRACCGGRGVFLMRELSDNIHFHDNGRTVEIHFHL
jgi:serine/threonine-protein kinase RsbW